MKTSRLTLRPWQQTDAEALYRYAKDPDVGPRAGWPPHESVEQSREIIRTVFAAPEVYAMALPLTDEAISCVGLLFGADGNFPLQAGEAEIGYWIGTPHQGKGLTTEAVRRLLQRCFEELHLHTVWGSHYEGNLRSARVLEKCGFRYVRTATDPEGRTVRLLRLTRRD